MPSELGTWLRQQRQARSWPVREMARQLRDAAISAGDNTVPGIDTLARNIRRWEAGHSGISERYALHYCKALGIPPGRFGPNPPPDAATAPAAMTAGAPGSPAVLARPLMRYFPPGLAGPRLLPPAGVAYRWMQEPDLGDFTVEREVLMAAHEGSEYAERAEQRDIGDATLEQLRADVVRLSRQYMTGEPLLLFLEMRRVRNRMHAALDRHLWPRDTTELYLLLGCLNCMMGVAAAALGYLPAGEELMRSGWAYATVIDHKPLMTKLRLELAYIAYWRRPRQARDLAASGLQYLSDGPNAAHLQLVYGRASGRLGEADAARRAVAAAHDARARDYHDDLLDIGGEFSVSLATHHYFAGSALTEVEGAEPAATAELERAATLYAAGPGSDELHWFGGKSMADIDLATVQLGSGGLDAAAVALAPVLSLPPGQRIMEFVERLGRVRAGLARSRYQGSAQARELDDRIEEFISEAITSGLHSLPVGPA